MNRVWKVRLSAAFVALWCLGGMAGSRLVPISVSWPLAFAMSLVWVAALAFSIALLFHWATED